MLRQRLDAHSRTGVRIEELKDHVARRLGEPSRKLIVSPVNLLVHGYEIAVVEWEVPCEKHVEDDPTGPGVGFGAVVAAAPADDLGRRVSRGPARRVEQAVLELLGERREPEVRYLEVTVLVQEKVLGLHVAVCDAVLVAEAQRRDQLLEVAARGGLGKLAAAADLGEELAARGELHDEVDLCLGGHDFVDFEDVWVVFEASHGHDLSDYPRLHGRIDSFGLVDDLHRHCRVVDHGPGLVDLGEAAPA